MPTLALDQRSFGACVGCGVLILTALATCPQKSSAIGVRIPSQDPEALARGNAFAATADNPSALYYNPAGISQLPGQTIQVGVLNYIGIDTQYESKSGKEAGNDFEVLPVPELYYTYSLQQLPLSFGVGVYAPFGLGVEWPEITGFRSLAIESRLQYVTVNPVVAWQIHPKLSVAIGPNFDFSELKLNRGLATPNDVLEFKGRDNGYGFHAGILWQPHSQWSFGANYRSATIMEYSGHTRYEPGIPIPAASTTARFEFPQIASVGISYRPTPKWNIEVDVDWADWSVLDTVTLHGSGAIFGQDLPLQLNWHDSWLYEAGVTRNLPHGYYVSAGYFFSTDTTSEQHFTPAVPDTDLHVGSLGFGYKGKHWRWALAGQLITGPERAINNSQPNPFTGESGNGKYQLTIPAIATSIAYHF
jgi:long-chain fatty acid transport protein